MKKNVLKAVGALILALALIIIAVPAVRAETFTPSTACGDLVVRFETCKYKAEKDPAGIWVIGYQHTKNVTENTVLTNEAEARALLEEDLAVQGGYVNDLIKKGYIKFEMNQNRFDALTAFSFNCGSGNLQKLVYGRTAEEVATKILTYTRGGGKVLPILVERRQAERDLFVK